MVGSCCFVLSMLARGYFSRFYKLNCFYLQEKKLAGRKNPPARPLGMIIKVKPQTKKARIEMGNLDVVKSPSVGAEKHLDSIKPPNGDANKPHVVANTGLVSYSDDSEED